MLTPYVYIREHPGYTHWKENRNEERIEKKKAALDTEAKRLQTLDISDANSSDDDSDSNSSVANDGNKSKTNYMYIVHILHVIYCRCVYLNK
jgi:hypothetical protein